MRGSAEVSGGFGHVMGSQHPYEACRQALRLSENFRVASCQAFTRAGQPCRSGALAGSDRCLAHSPPEVKTRYRFGGVQEGSGRPMTELKDALELLTDRKYLLRTEGRMAQMQASAILVELQADGTDLDAARALAGEAVAKLDGRNRSGIRRSSNIGSRPQWVNEYWVPEDKLRST